MFVAETYLADLERFANLNDPQFMALQIWQLQHVFQNELASIKDTEHKFVAFTRKFAIEFAATSDNLGKSAEFLPGVSANDFAEIQNQETQIMLSREMQDSIYLLKKNKDAFNYVVRKRPLVNPATNMCVGIFSNANRAMPGLLRKLMLNKFLPLKKSASTIINTEISEQQRQIIFCLLLGFHSRKEIAAILSSMSKTEYNETQVKNSLRALYHKFDCNTPGQLLNLISSGQINIQLPAAILATGNFPFEAE